MIQYSVIIPTYKGFKRLPVILDSLCRQSVPKEKTEIIVVDDKSPGLSQNDIDSLCHSYRELNLRVLQMPENKGPAAARNFGIENSLGEIIFFTDDDCEVPALWMETHLNVYRDHPEISAVGGWYACPLYIQRRNIFTLFVELLAQARFSPFIYQVVDSNLFHQRKARMRPEDVSFAAVNTANFSVKRVVFSKVEFNEQFPKPGYEDILFSDSIRKAGFVICNIPFFVYHHRRLTFKNFFRFAFDRGFGLYIYSKYINFDLEARRKVMRERFVRYVTSLAMTSPLIRKKKMILIFIANTYYSIPAYLDFWYRFKISKMMRQLSAE